jgi:hypothetical protein
MSRKSKTKSETNFKIDTPSDITSMNLTKMVTTVYGCLPVDRWSPITDPLPDFVPQRSESEKRILELEKRLADAEKRIARLEQRLNEK